MNCPQCGSQLKTVPAGVSKSTGRPYPAFTVCSNRNCNWKPTQPAQGNYQPAPQQYQAPQPQYVPTRDDRIQKAFEQKQDSIAWSVALNNATQIVCRMIEKYGDTPRNYQQEFANWTRFIYNLDENDNVPASIKNGDITVDEIPFE
jgi:hypothetical protein